MKIIHKTMLKELGVTFLVALAFLNSVLMMEKLIRLSRLLSGVGATMTDFLKIIAYIQPQLLSLTIPMAMLLATLIVYGRMHADNEMIILRSSGMDFTGISRPVFMLGAACLLFSLLITFYFGPQSSIKIREVITQIITARTTLSLEEGAFNTAFRDVVIRIKGKKSADMLEGIFIYDNRQKDAPKVLMAQEGTFYAREGTDIGLYLTSGYINITKEMRVTEVFFDRYNMTLSIEAESPAPKRAEFSPFELLEKTKETDTPKKKAALFLELHRRFSLPVVCLVLMFLGPPLSLIAGKSGRLGGLALGLFTFMLYYIILIYGENLVMAGKLHHAAGAWIAIAVLGSFAGFMFARGNAR